MSGSGTIIVEAGYVLTSPKELLKHAAVAVQGNRIMSVRPSKVQRKAWPDAKVLSFPNCLVMAGLVNGHQHGRGLSQIQLGYHDDFLEPWIMGRRARGALDPYVITKLAAARMIANGVTTTIHANYAYGTGEYEREVREQIDAYRSTGIRSTMCIGAMDQGMTVYPPHEACFMAGLDHSLRAWLTRPGAMPYCKDGPGTIALMKRLLSDYESESLIRLCYGPAGPQWVSDNLWTLLVRDAQKNNLGLHLHALESPAQRDAAQSLYPQGVFEYLDGLGAMTGRTVIAHGVWVDDREMEVLVRCGATVVQNPGCNIRMRNGIAPLARFLQSGIRVAIGTDNCSMQDDEDLLSELRLAGNLGREADWNGPRPPNSQDLIAMVTTNGAVAAQFGEEIGTLEPGRLADIVAFSLDRTRQPYLDTEMPLVDAFLCRSTGADTHMTMVDGKVLYLNGTFSSLDIAELEAKAAASALVARQPRHHEDVKKTEILRSMMCDHYRNVARESE